MVSSLIQVALFSGFGILLPGIIWLLNKRSTANFAPSTILLRKFQTLLFETSGFLMITIFVTAIFTCSQASNPSVTELTFISSLLGFQFWCIFSVLMSQSADKSINQVQVSGQLQLFYYVLFIAQLVTSTFIKIPNHSVYKALAKECHKQHQFIDVISSVIDGRETSKYVGIGLGGGVCFIVLVVLGFTYITHIPPLLARPCKMVWSRIPTWLKNYADINFNFLLIGLYAGDIPLQFYRLEKVRKFGLQMSGAQRAGEEQWGYGQTTAILLWLPFFFSAIKETISKFPAWIWGLEWILTEIEYIRNPLQPETPQAEMEPLTQGKSTASPEADAIPPPYDFPYPAAISTATPEVATKWFSDEWI